MAVAPRVALCRIECLYESADTSARQGKAGMVSVRRPDHNVEVSKMNPEDRSRPERSVVWLLQTCKLASGKIATQGRSASCRSGTIRRARNVAGVPPQDCRPPLAAPSWTPPRHEFTTRHIRLCRSAQTAGLPTGYSRQQTIQQIPVRPTAPSLVPCFKQTAISAD